MKKRKKYQGYKKLFESIKKRSKISKMISKKLGKLLKKQ